MLKKVVILVLIFVTLSTITHADVLTGNQYYEKLKEYIAQAEKSIIVAMYYIILEEDSPVNILIDELISASKRGVEVEVVLEDGKLGKSMPAYNKLKENNIDVKTDFPGKLLHLKCVIIDKRYVFLGSANWSKAAMKDNYEATFFTDSKEDADKLIQFIRNLTVKDKPKAGYKGVALPTSFLLSPKKGRILLKAQAKDQLRLYLLLLKEYAQNGKTTFKLNEKKIVEEMGYTLPKKIGGYKKEKYFYHDTLRNLLKRLERKGFLKYKKKVITLLDIDQSHNNIIIPFEYWEYGYANTLSMRASYAYLISLYEEYDSIQYPYWFHSQEDMSKIYGIGKDTISKGLLELEKIGILEVTRDKVSPPDFSERKANVYRLLPLKTINEE